MRRIPARSAAVRPAVVRPARLCALGVHLHALLGRLLRRPRTHRGVALDFGIRLVRPGRRDLHDLIVLHRPGTGRAVLLRVVLAHQHLLVDVDHLLGGSLPQLDALIQQDDPVAVLADIGEIMGDKEHGLPLLLELIELVVALRLKEDVSHRERLIHDQNLRLDVDRHGEGEPHEHTRGIRLDRLIDIFPDVGKIQNRVDLLRDLLL